MVQSISGVWKKLNEGLFRKKWFTCLLLTVSALGLGFLSLAFATVSKRWDMLESYCSRPLLLLLNLLPCVALCLLLWLLCNRPVIAYAVTAALVFGFTLANWYKLQFRNDPLMFEDLFLVKEAGNMLGRYSLFLTPSLALAFLLILAGGVLLFFCARGRFQPGWKRFALAGAALALCAALSPVYSSSDIYNKKTENFDHVNRWAATDVYISKGFLYPFLHSVPAAFPTPPEGYSKAQAKALLESCGDADIPEEKKVDVIGVMLEAFNDFSKYDEIQFMGDPYQAWHTLEEESVHGNLVTSIFAGGTVTTERQFLTGCVNPKSPRGLANSYAWYFADQGYTVTGSHPSYGWFYNRQNINSYLGFETYLFSENHYADFVEPGAIARDEILLPEMERLYEEHKENSDDPYFSFSVTYQGHGPYSAEENKWGEEYVKPGAYTKASENILNNYFASVHSTGEELLAFADFYRNREEPVILVLFGDHNPWLGDDNSVYKELGLDLDLSQKQGFMNYYCTRYVIWANDAAKKVLGNDFTGEGPDISPNFLMNLVFQECGWEGPAFLQYTNEVMEKLPAIQTNSVCLTAEGEVKRELEDELAETRREYLCEQYYMQQEFQHQDIVEARKAEQ